MSFVHVLNGESPHVTSLLENIDQEGNSIISFGEIKFNLNCVNSKRQISSISKISWIELFFEALIFRFRNKDRVQLHGHSAGKIGLFCLLTGYNYSLTIYGSEVYQSRFFTKFLVNQTLKSAIKIHVYSWYMKSYIVKYFNINETKIYVINPGIDISIFNPDLYRMKNRLLNKFSINENDVVFFISRRVARFYNTLSLLKSLIKLNEMNPKIKVLVLAGNSEDDYLDEVIRLSENYSFIKIISGFVKHEFVAELFSISDYSLSFPNSDEISATVLQSIAMGCTPIVNIKSLEVYKEICYIQFCDLNQIIETIQGLIANNKCDRKLLTGYGKSFDNRLAGRAFSDFFKIN